MIFQMGNKSCRFRLCFAVVFFLLALSPRITVKQKKGVFEMNNLGQLKAISVYICVIVCMCVCA